MLNDWCPKEYNKKYPPHHDYMKGEVCFIQEYYCMDSHRCPKNYWNYKQKEHKGGDTMPCGKKKAKGKGGKK